MYGDKLGIREPIAKLWPLVIAAKAVPDPDPEAGIHKALIQG